VAGGVGAIEVEGDDDDRLFVLQIVQGRRLAGGVLEGDIGNLRAQLGAGGLVGGPAEVDEHKGRDGQEQQTTAGGKGTSHNSLDGVIRGRAVRPLLEYLPCSTPGSFNGPGNAEGPTSQRRSSLLGN